MRSMTALDFGHSSILTYEIIQERVSLMAGFLRILSDVYFLVFLIVRSSPDG